MRYRRFACAVALLALTAFVRAEDVEFDKLAADFMDAQMAYWEKMEKVAAEAEGDEIDFSKMPPSPTDEFMPKFRALAEQRSGKSAAIPALSWMINNGAMSFPPSPDNGGAWALQQLTKNHAADPQIAKAFGDMQFAATMLERKTVDQLVDEVLKQNKDDDARAAALFTRGLLQYNDAKPSLMGAKPSAEAAKTARDNAVKTFSQLQEKFGDTEYAKNAENYVFEIKNLQIGMKAPDIVGKSPTGETVRLSQFHGQVVVLDFWGFW